MGGRRHPQDSVELDEVVLLDRAIGQARGGGDDLLPVQPVDDLADGAALLRLKAESALGLDLALPAGVHAGAREPELRAGPALAA